MFRLRLAVGSLTENAPVARSHAMNGRGFIFQTALPLQVFFTSPRKRGDVKGAPFVRHGFAISPHVLREVWPARSAL
jgi:hypothetical protein